MSSVLFSICVKESPIEIRLYLQQGLGLEANVVAWPISHCGILSSHQVLSTNVAYVNSAMLMPNLFVRCPPPLTCLIFYSIARMDAYASCFVCQRLPTCFLLYSHNSAHIWFAWHRATHSMRIVPSARPVCCHCIGDLHELLQSLPKALHDSTAGSSAPGGGCVRARGADGNHRYVSAGGVVDHEIYARLYSV
jgi:hypothetical protein